MDCSVVIASKNRPEQLARCLAALQRQIVRPRSVIVVDDGSTPSLPELDDVLLVRHPRSRGPGAARNSGWRSSTASYIAFTDDDCVPSESWLKRLIDHLHSAPPDVAGVGGTVLSLRPGVVGRYMEHHRILEPPPSLGYLVTANCAYRRTALEEVGGFDESLTAPGGEDPGLSFALRDRGYRFSFEKSAVVRHEFRESFLDFVGTFFRYGRGCRSVMG